MYYSLNFIICIFISQHHINVFYYWPLRVSVQLSADIWTCLTGSSTAASKNQKTKLQFYLENEPKICRFIWFDCSVLLPPWQQKNTVLSFLLKNLAGTLNVNMKRETKDILCRHGDSDTLLRFTFCQMNKPKSVSSAVRFSFWAERLHVLQHVSGLTPPPPPHLCPSVWSRPSDQVVLSGHEDQGDLFVSGAQQRKHPVGELVGSGEAVDLWARLHVIKGHLTLVHVQEHAHLTQLRRTLNLHDRNIFVEYYMIWIFRFFQVQPG